MKQENSLEYYCTFVGYPKSGHSLIGSLLDAHPNMIIAHELNVLKCLKMDFKKETIHSLILQNSAYHSMNKRSWCGYSYIVPNQWNGQSKDLRVIGDKKGGGTSVVLYNYPELLDKLRNTFVLNHKFIHVSRNPFDSMTTFSLTVKKDIDTVIRQFFRMWKSIEHLKNTIAARDWMDIRHEVFISEPTQCLVELCRFLGQNSPEDYLADCARIVNPVEHKSRYKLSWAMDRIKDVEREMQRYPFLQGYSYDS